MTSAPARNRRSLLRILALAAGLLVVFQPLNWLMPDAFAPRLASAHNLQTKLVYMFPDSTTQTLFDNRIAGGWTPGTPLLLAGDSVGMIIKVVPRDGTSTGVGGHIDFYVPNGVTVEDTAYYVPNGSGGYTRVAMKGQSPIPVGAGPVGAKTTADLIGMAPLGPNVNGVTEAAVTGTGLHRGTIAGLYGDTGIFYSVDPDTSFGSWQRFTGDPETRCGIAALSPTGKTITNNSGDVFVPCNKWDAEQMYAFGAKGTTYAGAGLVGGIAIVDTPDQRGNAPWGHASGVAGPQSGYKWNFDWDEWVASARTAADKRSALANDEVGPWQRIKYEGSRISKDMAGSSSTTNGYASVDGSAIGVAVSPSAPLPATVAQSDGTSPKAVRWAVGQLTENVPELVYVRIKVNDPAAILDATGCPVFHGDTFGGDAGGASNGKDHLWRYYEPSEVTWNGCAGIGKPATRDIVSVGDTFQYKVKFYNLGTLTLTNVIVRDTLASGVQFLSAVPAQNSGPNPLQWNVGTLKPGQKFEATVTVKATSSGLLDNCIVVDTNELPDQEACETTFSGALPLLNQTKSVSPTTVAPGGTVQYTLNIANVGTGPTGSPVTIQEFLPTGFTFVSKDLVTINGANVTAATTVCTTAPNCSTNEPTFTVPGAINAGQSLVLKFTALVPVGTPAGSYCNVFATTQNGIPQTTGSAGCVDVGGGAIGDRLWRDWDGDGVQDADEEGIPGVTLELQNGVCTPGTNCPTKVTDATGFYQFTGLLAGTYTVKVLSGIPVGYTQTGDPDSACPSAGCNGQSTVTLATNEKKLDRDFGYKPGGTGSIGDQVFDDKNADGAFNASDAGIPNVAVNLYEDTNGNGVIDVGTDALVATTSTNGSGVYSFSGLATGIKYIADVVQTDPDITSYFVTTYGSSIGVIQTTTDPHNVGTLAGAYTAADFGFYKTVPGSIGDDVFIDSNKNGVRDAGESGIANVTVYLYADSDGDGQITAGEPLLQTTTTDANGKYLFGNLPTGNYIVLVNEADPDIPSHLTSTVNPIAVSLAASQQRTDVDFPFVESLKKTVNLAFANVGQTLNFTLSPYHPGGELLSNVRVLDPVPTGVTISSVGQGGANAAYIQLPGEVGTDVGGLVTTITVSPIVQTKGGVISVVVNLKSNAAVTNVSPTDFTVLGGSATCTGPTPASGTVPAGGAGLNFTYSCTLNAYGEYQFSAGAENTAQTTSWPTGLSASAFAHAGGGPNVIQWNLGSNTAGTPGEDLASGASTGVYGFRGATTKTFAKFSPDGNSWTAKADSPDNVRAGGALATDGVNIYALAGNLTKKFNLYTVSSNSWTVKADTPGNIGEGGALVRLGNYVYALRGDGQSSFYRYDITTGNTWSVRANLPQNVTGGGALTTDGTYIYALRGDRKKDFYRYDVGANTWTAMANVPANVKNGGALTRVGGHIYALRGDNKNNFYRYDISANTWSSMANAPGNVQQGGALTNDGTYVYGLQGNTNAFWRYNIAANTWATRTAYPAVTDWGGALVHIAASGAINRTNTMSAAGTVVTTGNRVQLKMVLTSLTEVTGVVPGSLSTTVTGGASASCAGPTPASQTVPAGNVPATFTWDCTMTAGANPGSVAWSATATGAGPTVFASATSNSVLVSPVLTFSGTVNGSPPATILNTGFLAETSGELPVTPSNTTRTATTSTLGDFVWNDYDHDGVQDAGEPGIPGVRVYIDSNANGSYDIGEPVAITDGNGAYQINNLANGTYTVRMDTSTLPANYYPTTPPSLSRTITSAGQQITDADFGATQRSGSIGDTIWLDADEDGTVSGTEVGIANVTVNLYRDVNNNNAIDAGDYIIATRVTNASGTYLFDGLFGGVGGNFIVDVVNATLPSGVELVSPGGRTDPQAVDLAEDEDNLTIDFGYNYSGKIGDFAWYDKDGDTVQDGPAEPGCTDTGVNECGAPDTTFVLYLDVNNNDKIDPGEPVVAVTVTDENGAYLFDNLPPGNYVVQADEQQVPAPATSPNAGQIGRMIATTGSTKGIDLAPGTMVNLTADFGFIEGAEIEGYVYHDVDHNGIKDAGEPGLPNVTVTLSGTDVSGNPVSLMTTTDADGEYTFIVPPGTYTVTYDTADPDIPAALTESTTPTSSMFSVAAGAEHMGPDFGRDNPGKIGDRVWNDANGNGVQNAGEPGLPGVTVELIKDVNNDNLWDPDGLDNILGNADDEIILATQATDVNGLYLFQGLPDGNYLVRVNSATLPSGYTQTFDNSSPTTDHLGQADISGGNTILTVDFGYKPPVNTYTIVGNIWKDNGSGGGTAGDGTRNGGEPGIPGVSVCLYNSTGTTTIQCTTTDANGAYAFPGIPNGGYVVRVDPNTLPNSAYVQTGDPDSACPGAGCNHESGVTVSGANPPAENFGYQEKLGSINGKVVVGDGDGLAEVGEPAVAGVLVILTGAGPDGFLGTLDDTLRTTTTDAAGYYEFTGLLPSTYQITKVNPDGTVAIADRDGGNPNSIGVTLAAGGTNVTTRDFEVGSSIGDLVWLDTDGDGVYDVGEPGLANVAVTLYADDGDGIFEPGTDDVQVAATTTDASGNYIFDTVVRGTYWVDVDGTTLPAGLAASPGTTDPRLVAFAATAPYLDADFGYTSPPATAIIGDFVWRDADGDGVQDPGESGFAGVTVALKGPGADGILGTGDDVTVATATTDVTGHYLFTGVLPGEYWVDVTDTGAVLADYGLTSGPQSSTDPTKPITVAPGDVYLNADFGYAKIVGPSTVHMISDTVWYDADGDGVKGAGEDGIPGVTVNLLDSLGQILATTTTAADGTFAFPGLDDGSYTIQIGDIGGVLADYNGTTTDASNGTRPVTLSGADVTGVHFGYNQPVTIGDTVWSDANGNGVQDPGEGGIAGVQVKIYRDANSDGKLDTTVDTLVATVTTDAGGHYLLPGLVPGTYFASVDPAQTALTGYTATTTDQETGPNAAGIQIEAVLAIGGTSFLDADFGFQKSALADVSGNVWNDLDKDGVDDGVSEPPIAGVTVALLDANGNVVATTTTDAGGQYTFPDVAPGNYTVAVTDDAGRLIGYQLTSGLDEIPITVASTDITNIDFGYVRDPETARIGDTVWLDADGDGAQDGAEPGIGGATVRLYDVGPDGVIGGGDDVLVATTITDANGRYAFAGLPPGNYYVAVDPATLPNGGTGLAETTGGLDNRTGVIALSTGENYRDADLGYSPAAGTVALGDLVWYDIDEDSIQDPGEVGIGGATVTVTGPGCAPCVATTDPDGSWLVTGLQPGQQYQVVVTPPAGYNTTPTNGSATRTYEMSTSPEMDILYADFGFKRPSNQVGSIGDRVWLDVDRDGVQDAGEPGLGGVTINLVNNSGGIIATTTTAADGSYLFVGVLPGTYTVVVTDLAGVLDDVNQSYDPDEAGVCTVCNGVATVVVVGGANITTVDFGYKPTAGSIGNQVWHDVNGDGVYQPKGADNVAGTADDETPMQGVTVQLYVDVNGNGSYDAGVDNLVRTAVTDVNGMYSFAGTPPGKYLVDFAGVPGFTKTAGTAGVDNNSQANPYAVVLTPGSPTNVTADFGLVAAGTPHSISGTTFNDTDNDGVLDWPVNDHRIPNIWVYLYIDLDGDKILDPGEPLIASQLSDAIGGYNFPDLPDGNYIVIVDAVDSRLDGFNQTTQQGGAFPDVGAQWVTLAGADSTDNDFGFYAPVPAQTTPVTISSFNSKRVGDVVRFTWTTATETGNVGFNLYAATSAGLERLNDRLIPTQLMDSTGPQHYTFEARSATDAPFVIEDVAWNVETRMHGVFDLGTSYGRSEDPEPIDWTAIGAESAAKADERSVAERADAAPVIAQLVDEAVSAADTAEGEGSAITADDAAGTDATTIADDAAGTDAAKPKNNTAVTSSPVARFEVTVDGAYRVTYEQLRGAGIDLNRTPTNQLGLTSQGKRVPIVVTGAKNFGPGSAIEFVGEAATGQYTRTNVYVLLMGYKLALNMAVDNAKLKAKAAVAPSYMETTTADVNRAYSFSSPNGDPWYDRRMLTYTSPQSWTIPLALDHVAPGGTPHLVVETWGVTNWGGAAPDHHMQVSFNGAPVADERFDGLTTKTVSASLPAGVLVEGNNALAITLPGDTGFAYDLINMDRFSVTYPRQFVARDGALTFEAAGEAFAVRGLPTATVVVYRIVDGIPTKIGNVSVQRDGTTYSATFPGNKSAARYLVVADPAVRTPSIGTVRPAVDITSGRADYVMITHPDFIAGIQPLVDYHTGRGLRVKVVDVRDVYDQFGDGLFGPDAIDAYTAHAVQAMGARFLLLVGGDSYDYLNYLGAASLSFVPTQYVQTDDIVHYSPTDALYADADGDQLPDAAIGRLPVRTSAELASIVQKTLAYSSKSYSKTAVFAADGVDPIVDFTALNEQLIGALPGGWNVARAHVTEMGVAGAKAKLLAQINQGVALTSYVGHSGLTAWTFQGLLSTSDVAALTNAGKPTVVTQWGCWNTYFTTPAYNTLAHKFLLSGDKGAAAVLGASTLTEASSEAKLGSLLLPRLVAPGASLGESVQAAKRELATTDPERLDVLLGWTILGDPALVVQP